MGTTRAKAAKPDVRDQLGEHLLGAVGRGRDAVGGEDAEGRGPAQPLAAQLLVDQGRPEQHVLHPVAEGLGQVDFTAGAAAGDRRPGDGHGRCDRPPDPFPVVAAGSTPPVTDGSTPSVKHGRRPRRVPGLRRRPVPPSGGHDRADSGGEL